MNIFPGKERLFMEQLKKNAHLIAGIAFIVYAVIGFIRAGGFFNILFYIAALAIGVSCFIKKTELVKIIGFGLMAFVSLSFIFKGVLSFLEYLIRGYLGFGNVIFWLMSMFSSVVELIGIVAMAILLFMLWKKAENILTKFWYAPAGVVLVSVIISSLASFLNSLFSGYFRFSVIFYIAKNIVVIAVLVVGMVSLAFSMKENDKVEG